MLFDAAHLCGMIAGHAWQQPLDEGAHVMTMSTYKSLGGPPGGLIVTNDAALAERIESIAYPGPHGQLRRREVRRAGRDAARLEAAGREYAAAMAATAGALAEALVERGVPVFAGTAAYDRPTSSPSGGALRRRPDAPRRCAGRTC